MTPNIRLRGALTGLALLAASTAMAADNPSQSFLKDAIQGNLADISAGKLAVEKGTSDAVKRYGQTLITDANKANAAATDAAKSLGVAIPLSPNPEQVALHDKLAKEPSSKAFDTDFVNAMLQAHVKDIASYQSAADSDKDVAGRYAGSALPVLQNHLNTDQTIAKGMGL